MPKNPNADETVLHSATTKGNSLRITIPAFIISSMNLKKGDVLKWKMITEKDGDTYLDVRRVKEGD